jgi:hypothetical protein
MFSGQYSDKIGEEIGRTLINLATEVQPMALGLQ